MKEKQFVKIIEQQIDQSKKLLFEKSEGYNAGGDKLRNFRVSAELQDITVIQAIAGMMSKHTVSVYDLCRDDIDGAISLETWNEKITDSINYLLLLKAALVDERYKKPIPNNKVPVISIDHGPELNPDTVPYGYQGPSVEVNKSHLA